ncbi:unnamed protein product [Closterium sp. Naga37s-1]|nr:unnamed protein product [Closterium sp. Naga37s-1]
MLYTGYLRSLAGVMGAQGGWARRGDGRAGGMGTWDETGEGARGTVAGRGNAVHGIPVHAGGMGPPPSPCLVILTRCALSCHRLLPFRRISTASLTNFRPLLHSPPPRPNLPSALSAPRLRPRPRFLPPSAALLSLHSARPALAGSQQRKNIRRRTLHSPHSPTPSPLFPTLSPLSALPHPIPWIPSLSSLPCIPPSHSLSHPFHPSACPRPLSHSVPRNSRSRACPRALDAGAAAREERRGGEKEEEGEGDGEPEEERVGGAGAAATIQFVAAPTGQSLAPAALRMPPSAGWRDADARCLALRLIGCLAPLAADVAHVQELVVRAAMEAEGQQELSLRPHSSVLSLPPSSSIPLLHLYSSRLSLPRLSPLFPSFPPSTQRHAALFALTFLCDVSPPFALHTLPLLLSLALPASPPPPLPLSLKRHLHRFSHLPLPHKVKHTEGRLEEGQAHRRKEQKGQAQRGENVTGKQQQQHASLMAGEERDGEGGNREHLCEEVILDLGASGSSVVEVPSGA